MIEGVSTSTAGFVGRALQGPLHQAAGPITSLAEYAKQFGDGADFGDGTPDFLWHAVNAFFTEGGKRLWVARVASGDVRPSPEDYRRGLAALEAVEEISTIAAPGLTHGAAGDAVAVCTDLIGHAERTGRCIALLDAPCGQDVAQVLDWRRHFASSRAALYYPWIRIRDAPRGRELLAPPSGAIAGIIARNDAERGVHRAPANQVIHSAIGLERALGEPEQEVLNPNGVNCIRAFEGRGIRVWGSRTLDPGAEWKYVNVRRQCIYLEQSIEKGLGRAVLEPNAAPLWAKVRRTIEEFLVPQWRGGALVGEKPEEAFYVRCDRTTMTQYDIDAGRLVCEIGVAPLKPAEFVVLRIGLNTARA
jgi:phage tail sheath protein FI